MKEAIVQTDSLSRKTKFLFSTGDLSSSLTLAIQMFFQLYFLTDVARLDPATVGWILGITRLWDSINDPLVGMISDRLKSRLGRRRALLAYGSLPLGIFFPLCWIIPPFEPLGLAIYYTLILIAYDTAFTIVHVGYNALTPTMTHSYDERARLVGYRMFFSLGGTLFAVIFATVLAEFTGTEATRFIVLGVSLGAIATIPPWIVFHVAREADNNHATSHMSVGEALRTTFANRAFVLLILMYLACWTATSVLAAMLVYFASYYLEVPEQRYYFVLVAQASAVASVPLCVYLANRWDKPRAFIVGIFYWCIVLVGFFSLPKSAVSLAYLCAILSGPGIATAAVIPWSMMPDVVEAEQVKTGERREGAYYAFAAFFQKLGVGIALWSIGQILAVTGYITPQTGNQFPAQPEEAVNAIRFIIGPGTISLLLVSIPFAWHYPITREGHDRSMEQLRDANEKTQETANEKE